MQLHLDEIRTDGGTQPRGQIDWGVVAEYALDMAAGNTFPPIAVYHDGESYWLADGYHRYYATEQTGRKTIEADVRQGTQQDAQWYSYAANKSHGLRRSNDDKRRAVEAALRHPAAATLSVNQVAQHCGVGWELAAKVHKSIFSNREDSSTRTVTRGGTTYQMDTAQIGLRPSEPKPGISPVSFSADGQVATVTVTNGDVAGGLAAVMEAEPPAVADNPTYEQPAPTFQPPEPLDRRSVLECRHCGGNVFFKPQQLIYRCYQCDAAWPSLAQMYAELMEQWRAANRRLEDLKGLAQGVVVY